MTPLLSAAQFVRKYRGLEADMPSGIKTLKTGCDADETNEGLAQTVIH